MQAIVKEAKELKFGKKKLYINGELVDGANNDIAYATCPHDNEPIAQVAQATLEDTERALETAEAGFKIWSKLPLEERLAWIDKLRNKLLENSDLLRTAVSFEMGKTWEATAEDIGSITDSLKFYADEMRVKEGFSIEDRAGTHTHRMVYQPLGVVTAFLAWNFPLLNLGFKLGPALAAGCCIVIKASESSSISSLIIAELAHEINFPKGVITVLCGNRKNVGVPLCESTIPRLVTMIGSTFTAQKLIEQSVKTSIKRYSMECGGNAPFILFNDGNMEDAVGITTAIKFGGNAGQVCVAPNRLFIQEGVYKEFVDKLVANANSTKLGHGKENTPDMGPVANLAQLKSVENFVADCVAQGGEILAGGKKIEGKGCYYTPTVIAMDNPKAPILQHEVFGPVCVVLKFKTKEEVMVYANDSDAGLASYVFTANDVLADEIAMELEFGEVQQNGVKYDINLPHLGVKNSGISMDCSKYALDDYLILKRISKKI
ncbi:aldehyde dehydrogenase family protein [Flammeovirga kamogawensis]|uniref:Aldehyde dehydrogenase family protein n=1 Tax=Flammeovirga kamogawensis TaxID=373891 RepID=A0ABX8H4T2_9BACT|nr:aldehyde dehydrogenase family protein [Flammeovirga kamogawensis]MBB6461956.1 succinate-semialdehyde dehydrogenase/glutarate-semialdehyde dehydrogenase [Flammeovirga kamogawensis]QWG10437.1 aldehyde dehydrogenase family protein [Flammeovirga kamogawensis]TRX63947.1 aldehyde dehydrogenase family protein [Flammeovirga kamogawensis]